MGKEEMVPWEGSGPESRGGAQPAAGHQAGPPGTPAGTCHHLTFSTVVQFLSDPVVKPVTEAGRRSAQFSDGDIEAEDRAALIMGTGWTSL